MGPRGYDGITFGMYNIYIYMGGTFIDGQISIDGTIRSDLCGILMGCEWDLKAFDYI